MILNSKINVQSMIGSQTTPMTLPVQNSYIHISIMRRAEAGCGRAELFVTLDKAQQPHIQYTLKCNFRESKIN